METAGALQRSFKGEREANASRYKWTILQKQKITHLAENKRRRPKPLDTNRRSVAFPCHNDRGGPACPETCRAIQTERYRLFQTTGLPCDPRFDSPFPYFLAASSRTLRPSHSNRNNTSFKNVRNPMSPNEKAFSNRNSTSLLPHSQPASVKLARHGAACASVAALGRAGLLSRRHGRKPHRAFAPEASRSALRSVQRRGAQPRVAVPQIREIFVRGEL